MLAAVLGQFNQLLLPLRRRTLSIQQFFQLPITEVLPSASYIDDGHLVGARPSEQGHPQGGPEAALGGGRDLAGTTGRSQGCSGRRNGGGKGPPRRGLGLGLDRFRDHCRRMFRVWRQRNIGRSQQRRDQFRPTWDGQFQALEHGAGRPLIRRQAGQKGGCKLGTLDAPGFDQRLSAIRRRIAGAAVSRATSRASPATSAPASQRRMNAWLRQPSGRSGFLTTERNST